MTKRPTSTKKGLKSLTILKNKDRKNYSKTLHMILPKDFGKWDFLLLTSMVKHQLKIIPYHRELSKKFKMFSKLSLLSLKKVQKNPHPYLSVSLTSVIITGRT